MKSQKFLFLNLSLIFFALLNSACVEQNSSMASSAPETEKETLTAADAEISDAQKIIEKMPDAATGYNKLAAVYIRRARETGDFSLNGKAEIAVNRALEIEPENPNAKKIKASLLLTFHRFEEALEYGKQLQKTYPKNAFVYGVLTDAHVELGNYEEAAEAVQQMVDLRPNMESYARASHLRSLYGDSAGAIEAMSLAARTADPSDREAQAWCLTHLGKEYFKIGNFAEAEKQYDAALKVLPEYHLALNGKADARAASRDLENAVKIYTELQNRVPITEAVISLGDIYSKTGRADEARKQYELAEFIEQKFDNEDVRRIALLWADHNVKLDEALEIAQKAYALRKDIYTADILAWCLYKKGRFAEAKAAINEAMRLKTKDARFFYHAGMIEKGLGNKKAAADYLQKALQTNPSFDLLQADIAKAALQELR